MENGKEPIYPNEKYGNIGAIGLTKREYFAVLAMQGFISSGDYEPEFVAKHGLRCADELLKQLEQDVSKL